MRARGTRYPVLRKAFSPFDVPGLVRWYDSAQSVYKDTARLFTSANSEYLSITSNSTLQAGDIDFWTAAWVYYSTHGTGYPVAVGKRDVSVSGQSDYQLNVRDSDFSNKPRMIVFRPTDVLASVEHGSALSANAWHLLVGYHDAANDLVGISVDGGAFTTAATGGALQAASASPFHLGTVAGTSVALFNGRMGPVFFGKSPSGGIAGVINAIRDSLYNGGAGKLPSQVTSTEKTAWGGVSAWAMTEASGDAADEWGTNTLTDNNTVTWEAGIGAGLASSVGDPVTAWFDLSGQGGHLRAGADSRRPTKRTASVEFNGSTNSLAMLTAMSSLTAATVFAVVKIDADPPGADAQSGLWDFGTDSGATHFPYTDGTVYDDFGANARKTTVNPSTTLAQWNVYEVTSKSGGWTSYLNGTQLYTTGTNTVAWNSAANTRLGSNQGESIFLDGHVAELLIYDSDLSIGDRLAVRQHLKTKWGTP